MIIHTLVFSFLPEMTGPDRDQFFDEMRLVVQESGLAQGFEHWDHVSLPPMDDHSPVFISSAIAEITLPDLNSVGALGSAKTLQEFLGRWQGKYPYKVVWVNHEPKA
jgi:hypothetical protein